MIDLHNVWLPQILSHAELVSNKETIRKAWLEGDRSQTSVTGLDELVEQVFEDSDSEAMLELANAQLADRKLVSLLRNFTNSILLVERAYGNCSDARTIVESPEWAQAVEAAKDLVSYGQIVRRG